MLVDTHCHIHESTYPLNTAEVLQRAYQAGVEKMICVGTNVESSKEAIAFAAQNRGVFASIGVHPHDAKDGWDGLESLIHPTRIVGAAPLGATHKNSIVAVGEIGLDYFYTHSSREVQIRALEEQIDLAIRHQLPVIFHVRDAFDDFWPIFDNFPGLRGELHSFTDTIAHMEQALARGLFIGVNGISTFTKDESQKKMFAAIPLNRLLLETDAPFLTPAPLRGRINEPAFVEKIAAYHVRIREITLEQLATATTANANALFALN